MAGKDRLSRAQATARRDRMVKEQRTPSMPRLEWAAMGSNVDLELVEAEREPA